MSLLAHVDHLRTLAALDTKTTVLQMAMINVMEELAAAVDRLEATHPPPDEGERGIGTV